MKCVQVNSSIQSKRIRDSKPESEEDMICAKLIKTTQNGGYTYLDGIYHTVTV